MNQWKLTESCGRRSNTKQAAIIEKSIQPFQLVDKYVFSAGDWRCKKLLLHKLPHTSSQFHMILIRYCVHTWELQANKTNDFNKLSNGWLADWLYTNTRTRYQLMQYLKPIFYIQPCYKCEYCKVLLDSVGWQSLNNLHCMVDLIEIISTCLPVNPYMPLLTCLLLVVVSLR
jgi:hypothetical protein